MIKNYLLSFCFLLCALLYILCPLLAQEQRTETRIDSVMKAYSMVGLSVAVVNNNKLLYTHSFGMKNREAGIPLSNTDIFRIASISKSFSATSIMQLVEQKKLSLQDDVSRLLGFAVRNPHFPDRVITLAMLLSHTSSLNDSEGYFSLDVINPATNPGWAHCYNSYEPGEGFEYCNLNFNLVGTIIERVSGERFDRYVKKHILDPLHLYGGYEVAALDSSRFATLYEYDTATGNFTPTPAAYQQRRSVIDNYRMGYSTPVFSPTGGMKISAADLATYMMMHMNYGKYRGTRIMRKKSARTMQTKVSDGEGGYGLAMYVLRDTIVPGKTMVGHTGSAYGLYSTMFFNPKEKWGIVAITNGCNPVYVGGFNAALLAILRVLYNEKVR